MEKKMEIKITFTENSATVEEAIHKIFKTISNFLVKDLYEKDVLKKVICGHKDDNNPYDYFISGTMDNYVFIVKLNKHEESSLCTGTGPSDIIVFFDGTLELYRTKEVHGTNELAYKFDIKSNRFLK